KHILERYIKILDNYILSILTDMNFIVLYISKAFCEKLMFSSKEEFYGISLKELVNRKKQKKIWKDIEVALQKCSWKGELLIKNNQNHYFWAET
ncbi:PAS domain-containing protein, partial [Escherichia coli]|uniref:PAS domain-containing protein n=1 Tax=Escherichia coli TaxID=562 RepID=UPI0013871898